MVGMLYYRTLEVQNENGNSYILTSLDEYSQYKVRMASHNNVGNIFYSPVATDKTMESTPSRGPVIV